MTAATWSFDVEGMHCASCVSRVEDELCRQPGVLEAAVNLAQARARLQVDATRADAAAIAHALERAGYPLSPVAETEAVDQLAGRHREEARRQLRTFIGAAVLATPVFVLGMSGIDAAWSRWLQLVLTTPAVFVFGRQFHRGALARARRGGADMDSLISIGSLAAYASSCVALWRGGPLYFETAAVIVTLILLGRSFEARAKGRASDAVAALASLGAREAWLLRDGTSERVPVSALLPGDAIEIGPGERVPADAVVVEGRGALDESMLTGESLPVDKAPGDALFGGTVNGNARLVAVVERVGSESALARITRAVQEAQASKAPVERLVDRIAGVFVPIVLAIAAATLLGSLGFGIAASEAVQRAVAVLVIACPCALGLATPTAVLVGCGRGAALGVLFRNAAVFERSRAVDTVVFDKTGTLTTGRPELAEVVCEGGQDDEAELLALAGGLERATGHPLGAAVARGAEARGDSLAAAESIRDLEVEPGLGASARVASRLVRVGRSDWLEQHGAALPPALADALAALEARGLTAFGVAWADGVRGVLGVADAARPSAAAAVQALANAGRQVWLVTGDAEGPARRIADELGIEHWIARARPEEKRAHVQQLQRRGAVVAFVGDGINDAPALAQSDLGIAVGGGTDVALETGDAVLLSSDPVSAVDALALARRTYRTIAQNLFWAFAYNSAAIPLAAFGGLDPMLAAGAMALSSLSVVLNSLRLGRFDPATRRGPASRSLPARATPRRSTASRHSTEPAR